MRRKFLSLLILTAMVTGLLTGCSINSNKTDASKTSTDAKTTSDGNSSADEKVTLSLVWWGNQTRNDLTQKAVELYMKDNPNITIKTEFTDWSGYWDKVSTMAAGGNLPDIMQQDYAYINQFQDSNQLADLTPFIEDGTIDTSKISESIIDSGKIDGSVYAISLGSNAPMMIYDKETVDKAGVTIPEQPTIDQLYDLGKTIYEKTGVKTYYDGGITMMITIARTTGSHLFDQLAVGTADSSLIHFANVDKFAKAEFSVPADLLVEKNPNVVETKPIIDKTAWNDFSFSNQFISVTAAAGRDLGICMYPTTADAKMQPEYLKPSMFFSIAETSKNKEEAAKFIDWFTNSKEANTILLAERGIPINSEIADYIKGQMDDVTAQVFDFVAKVTEIAEPIDAPSPSGSGEVDEFGKKMVETLRYGEISAEDATNQFVTGSKDILEEAAK
ncbi:MAG: ABC transporter substrate-binding protein [Anaerocolumna sp.]